MQHKIIGIETIDENRFASATNIAGQAVKQVPPNYLASVKLKIENSYVSITDMPVEHPGSMLALLVARRKLQQAHDYLDQQIKDLEDAGN